MPKVVSQQTIAELTSFYKKAYKDIVDEMVKVKGFQQYYRRSLLKDIRGILTELGVDVNEFIEDEISRLYKDGAKNAVLGLRQFGIKPHTTSGFQKVHKEAIKELVQETQNSFNIALNNAYRTTSSIISESTRRYLTMKLAEGMVSGKTVEQLKKLMIQDLKDNGLGGLVDKSGRVWSLDTYTEMLVRTKSVEAINRGLVNRMVENGYDLVVVSTHYSEHEACRIWEGELLSVTGNTRGYATLDDAKASGLFHPNCQHTISTYVEI